MPCPRALKRRTPTLAKEHGLVFMSRSDTPLEPDNFYESVSIRAVAWAQRAVRQS
jgi:hypothetical protein